MSIYVMDPDVETYQWLTVAGPDDSWDVLMDLKGTPVSHVWRPLKVEVLHEEDEVKEQLPGDFPRLAPTLPVFSRKALDKLRHLLEGHGEFLPLDCSDGDYIGFHVTRVVDNLNRDLSDVVHFTSGRVMWVKRFVLNAAGLPSSGIFRIPEIVSQVFVTLDFVQAVQESGLCGFKFEPVAIVGG